MGKVRIFCDCGKEIWDHPDAVVRLYPMTIPELEKKAECSDCLMDRTLKEYNRLAAEDTYPNPDV